MSEPDKKKVIGYWILTGIIVFTQFLSGINNFVQPAAYQEMFQALGYPLFMLYILGTWKILGTVVLAMPGKALWKEWAYAGFFFDFTGAVVTHLFVGDMMFPAPLVFTLILVGSYKLRPADRRLP